MSTETSPSLNRGSIAAFREDLILQGQSERTAKAYGSDLNLLLDFSMRRIVRAFDLPHEALDGAAKVWLLANKDNWGAATKRRRIAAVRAYARHHGIGSVLHNYKAPRPPQATPHPLPGGMDDVDRMLDASGNPQVRFVIAICGYMGLRVHEVVRLTTSNFDLATQTVKVVGKGRHERTIPIPAKAWVYIAPALNFVDRDALIIPRHVGSVRRWITQAGRYAGISVPVASHDLRHTAASHWLDRGADIRTIQELLGHQNVSTTEVYTSVTIDKMREAVSL